MAYIGTDDRMIKCRFMSFTPAICDIIHILKCLSRSIRVYAICGTSERASELLNSLDALETGKPDSLRPHTHSASATLSIGDWAFIVEERAS